MEKCLQWKYLMCDTLISLVIHFFLGFLLLYKYYSLSHLFIGETFPFTHIFILTWKGWQNICYIFLKLVTIDIPTEYWFYYLISMSKGACWFKSDIPLAWIQIQSDILLVWFRIQSDILLVHFHVLSDTASTLFFCLLDLKERCKQVILWG